MPRPDEGTAESADSVATAVPSSNGATAMKAVAASPVDDFQEVLFSLLHMCRRGSFSSAASSPREPPTDGEAAFFRSQSIISEDLSTLPPEEPEWLHMMVAAKARPPAGARPRSRAGSRRNSAMVQLVRSGAGPFQPSPLRHSVSMMDVESAAAALHPSGLAPPEDSAHPDACILLDRFGSCEGLSAAVDSFYRRLCSDERIAHIITGVPEQHVRYTMMELMAMTLEEGAMPRPEDRQSWLRHCQTLLRQQQLQQPKLPPPPTLAPAPWLKGTAAPPALVDSRATAVATVVPLVADDSCYDIVLQAMAETLQELGVAPGTLSAWQYGPMPTAVRSVS